MENERGRQEVLMALQGVGRLGIMMDPVFKLTAAGTILLIQHFARMYKEGLLNRREFQNFQEFAKLTEGNYQIINIPIGSWKELEKAGFVIQMEERGVRYVELPDLNQADGLVQAIADLSGKTLGFIKNCFDGFNILLTAVISLLFAGNLIGIGLGTILTVIGVGRVIALFNRLLESKMTGMAQVNKIE